MMKRITFLLVFFGGADGDDGMSLALGSAEDVGLIYWKAPKRLCDQAPDKMAQLKSILGFDPELVSPVYA
jgi:hypothetical protein